MDLDKDIQECPLVFLDLETTGLFVENSSICEVAAFKVQKGKVIDEFHSLVRPRRKVPYSAFCVHKISDRDLIGSPYFEGIAEKLVNFLDGNILCAYNAPFDLGFINYQLGKINFKVLNLPFVDILVMARKAIAVKSYKLESVADFFGLSSNIEFHRAKDDAYAAYLIFCKLIEILKKKNQPVRAKELVIYWPG